MEDYEFTPETSHPKAQSLLNEEFYWSNTEETSPFGNDDGAEASYGFWKWRQKNKNVSPIKYLERLLGEWDFPEFNLYELNPAKIQAYISKEPDSQSGPFSNSTLMDQLKQMAAITEDDPESDQFKEFLSNISEDTGDSYLIGMDNAVIAVAFAQFALEGKIDDDIKTLAQTVLKRELLPLLINCFSEDQRTERAERLTKMLKAVEKMNA